MLSRAKIFCFPPKNWKSCNFFIFWPILLKLHIQASEMDSFLTPSGLSNSGKEKLHFTPFWGLPKPGCSNILCAGFIESHNFFCLRSYPGEISHSNSPNLGLSNDISVLVVRRRKVALHTISHLTPTEAWRSAFPPLRRVVEFRARYRQIPVRRFWG